MRGLTLLYQSRLVEGWQDCVRAANLAVRIGDARAEMLARNMAMILLEQADLLAAEQEFKRSLELSRTLGAQRFEALCAAHLGCIAVQLGRRSEGLAQLRSALAQSRTIGDSFATPWLCGLLAQVGEGEERARALALGAQVLADGCVSHNHLWFHRYAIDAALLERDAGGAERHARELASHADVEPLPWVDFYARRGRLLAGLITGRSTAARERERERRSLIEQAREHRLLAALPALEAAVS
jgi:hypothetical protein